MLKRASGRAAAAMGGGSDPPPPPPKITDGGAGTGSSGRPASRLLSTRSLPSLFTVDSATCPASVAELSTRNSKGRNNAAGAGTGSRSGGGIGGEAATAGTGLAGVLVAEDEEADRGRSKNNRRVLLGMRLRVQLPPPPGKASGGGGVDLPGSPIEFGVKNRDAQLALLSPVQRSPLSSSAAPPRLARRSEVEPEELAGEDYTCVIARGPNPRMTHIFEDRVVESRADASGAACCFLTSSCSGCNKDAALLLKRGETELCSNQWK